MELKKNEKQHFIKSLKAGNYVKDPNLYLPDNPEGIIEVTNFGIQLFEDEGVYFLPLKLTEIDLINFGFILESTTHSSFPISDVSRLNRTYYYPEDVQDIKIEVIYDGEGKELRRIGIKTNEFTNLCFIDYVHDLQNIFSFLSGIDIKFKFIKENKSDQNKYFEN